MSKSTYTPVDREAEGLAFFEMGHVIRLDIPNSFDVLSEEVRYRVERDLAAGVFRCECKDYEFEVKADLDTGNMGTRCSASSTPKRATAGRRSSGPRASAAPVPSSPRAASGETRTAASTSLATASAARSRSSGATRHGLAGPFAARASSSPPKATRAFAASTSSRRSTRSSWRPRISSSPPSHDTPEPPDDVGTSQEPPDDVEGFARFRPPSSPAEAIVACYQHLSETAPIEDVLAELRQAPARDLVRSRPVPSSADDQEHDAKYVEWDVVACILDRVCPAWEHRVRSVVQIGLLVAVTASLSIRGVTREGLGTGEAVDERGIKKAKHDALKRAAVKFGIARELNSNAATSTPR